MGLKDWKGMLPLIGSQGDKKMKKNEETVIHKRTLHQNIILRHTWATKQACTQLHACKRTYFSFYTLKHLKLSLLKNLSTTTSRFNSTSAMSQTSLLFFSLSLALSVSLTRCCSNRPGQLLFQKADEIVPWSTAGPLDLTLKSEPAAEMFAYRS